MKKLKENFLESPPIYHRQLIPMIKQISTEQNYLFIQNLNSPHSLFQLGFEEHIPEKQNPDVRPANIQYFKL